MAITWEWTPEGLTIGERKFKIAAGITPANVVAYAERLAGSRSAWTSLRRALTAFENGIADYQNGYTRLKDLHFELASGRMDSSIVVNDVNGFFDPPEVTKEFGGDVVAMGKFAAEAAELLLKGKR